MISMNWIFQVSWVKSCIIKRANRVSSQSKESQSARKQASKCFLGDETRRKSRRKRGGGEGWSTSVRPYLRPDDRCRGPSLDKLSFVPSSMPERLLHGFVRLSLFHPRPSASLHLCRARARQLVRDWFRVDCKHSCTQRRRRRSFESRRNWAQDQEEPSRSAMPAVPITITKIPTFFAKNKDKRIREKRILRKEYISVCVYRRWCEKLREISAGESSGYLFDAVRNHT